MMSTRRFTPIRIGLLLLVLLPAAGAHAQSANCTGVAAWNPSTIYNPGDRLVYKGKLYQANVQIWNTAPDHCASCNWYTDLGACGGGNQPPTVSITAPANGATFTAPATITISADASDSDGTIARVEFRQGGTLIGTDTSAPYGVTWNNVPAGQYWLMAIAVDNAGGSTTAALVGVTVTGGTNTPPSVAISAPANGASFTAPANIAIAANASDVDGTVAQVQFRQGGTVIGTDTSAPFGVTWSNVPAGSYSLTAVATDNAGASTTSTPVNVVVSGGGGSCSAPQYVAGTAYAAGQQVQNQGELYRCDVAGWCSSNAAWAYEPGVGQHWQMAWTHLGGCGGGGTPPTVSLTSPANGATFNTGQTITVAATAADSDGSVVKVEFFDNGGKIGEDASAPYSLAWAGAGAGSHQLTAKATDNANNSTTSTAVTITINCSGSCGGSLPRHVITGYWQNFNNGARVLKLREVPSAYNLIAVAFADATTTPGAVTFNLDPAVGYSGTAEFIADISLLKGQGRKVILSVGGERGTVSVANAGAAANFASSVIGLMNQYGFDGVDIDLENGVSAQFMGQALRAVAQAKPGAIITMAPQTIDMQSQGMEYFKLALQIKDILTIINMQYYNSGTMLGCDGGVYGQGTVNFLTALACVQLQSALRPDQIGLGLPASPAAAGGGHVSASVVNDALDCLAKGTGCGSFRPPRTWPGIRGAMTWSINHDGSNGFAWVNAIAGHLPSVP